MKRFAGLALLLAVVVVVAVIAKSNKSGDAAGGPAGSAITLKGFVGGEKLNFLKDPDVIRILKDKYNLTLDYNKRGSLDMARDAGAANQDFLWPSSQLALEMYRDAGRPMVAQENIFNSPIVLFSWSTVTDALIKQGIVQKIGDAYFVTDMPALVKMTQANKPWKDIGLPQLYGTVTVYSTDPTKSNSGNMFAGLMANMVNGGQVVTDATLPAVLPKVKGFFDNQGMMEESSDAIFRQYMTRGMGDKPIIVGYEAQLLEYGTEHASELTARTEKVRLLYPKPTVWSSHPVIAITENGKRLIPALQDPEIQKLAWTRHGFRSAAGTITAGTKIADIAVPESIQAVIAMPSARVMRRVFDGLGGR